MPDHLTVTEMTQFSACPVKCPRLRQRVTSLADFLAVISDAIRTEEPFWFRGHADMRWSLTPSALRYPSHRKRVDALALMADFKRIADLKIQRPPRLDDSLMWAQIAQHYGLPTRLLDWTESATTALYFACVGDADGLVFILNPADLNRLSYPTRPRILDPQEDKTVIESYLALRAKHSRSGRLPIAVNPVWNSERSCAHLKRRAHLE